MTVAAAFVTIAAFVASIALVVPVARRSGLGVWHPAVAWLGLEAIFFGLGAVVLTFDSRPGPGLFVSGAVIAFALAVALSDSLARRRVRDTHQDASDADDDADAGSGSVRMAVVAGLAVLALVSLLPILLRVGLPFLASDITGARAEILGFPVQLIRVAMPALAIAVAIRTWRQRSTGRAAAAAIGLVAAIIALELVLGSRYLAAELLAALVIATGLDRRIIARRIVLAGALGAVVAFGGIQILRAYEQAEGRELAFAVERTVNRVVMIQPRTLEALQVAIPADQPAFGGLTWLRRLGLLFEGEEIPNLGYWVYSRMFPGQTVAGYAAPGLLGEAWANFAAAGILLFVPFGIAVERLGSLIGRRRTGTADIVAGSLAILVVARTHALGLNGMVLLLALVVVWRLAAGVGWRSLAADVARSAAWRT